MKPQEKEAPQRGASISQKPCYASKHKTFSHKRRKPRTPKQTQDSSAKSMPFSVENAEKYLGLEGLFDGKMTHLSFDCPKPLREAFKQECKANGTSTCKTLQHYMVAYVTTSRLKKHALGNTISKVFDVPLTIGSLNFEQNVQSRVRRYVPRLVDEAVMEVKKTKRVLVVNDLPDYSVMSLEELDRKHRLYQNMGRMGKSALVAAELKRRRLFNASEAC